MYFDYEKVKIKLHFHIECEKFPRPGLAVLKETQESKLTRKMKNVVFCTRGANVSDPARTFCLDSWRAILLCSLCAKRQTESKLSQCNIMSP